ncbi:hypothetical protein EB837_23135 [Kluyvera ascorbata]|uniref:Uncharacterized protein n=1 Tax=Kluyvera ascorbata TaxID=51288 RepID=A0A3N2RR59_9ENTR|nr:hypothetical protein EB837_23135 [Kluyvera ascorbata]
MFFDNVKFISGKESVPSTREILIAERFHFLREIIKNKTAITKNYFFSSNHIMIMFLQLNEFKIQFVNKIIQISI